MIRSFLVLAGVSSFSEAARQSFFTQQAISKQIARLETELGTVLFQRLHSGVRLTPEGELYYHAFKQAMDLVDQARDEVTRMQMGEDVHIRLGYMEMLIIDPNWDTFLRGFRTEHPELKLEVETYPDGEIMDMLTNDKVDAAILFCKEEEAQRNGLSYISLDGDPAMKLCVNRNYPGATQAVSYYDLRGITLFFPARRAEDAKARMSRLDFPLEHIRYCANISSALVAVNMLEGGILVGDHCEFRDNPNLLFFDVPSEEARAVLAWKKNNPKRSLRRMMDQFRIYCTQHPNK